MTTRKILFVLLLIMLALPAIQGFFRIIHLRPLKGAFVEAKKGELTMDAWLSGTYQQQVEHYVNEKFGFRDFFIRVNNQIDYTFFDKVNAFGVVFGKNKYLFDESYIRAYYGEDFIGSDSISIRMRKIKYLQDTLAKLNKTLIVVFAASKGTFYPEYFPNKVKKRKDTTNYEVSRALAIQSGINVIDFNDYFIKNKNISQYPLFPQYGIHWSYYGACLAADSLFHYIEKKRAIDMPELYWDEIEADDSKKGDYDIGDAMNLLFDLKSVKMGYPELKVEEDSTKTKPSVLVVSDSFYWVMFNFEINKGFSNHHFWFYNKEVYPQKEKGVMYDINQVDLKSELNNHDVIIIMSTDATLSKMGWGFIENAYDLFKKD